MKPRGTRAAASLPVGAMMALVLLVVAVVLVFAAFEQQSVNERKSADAVNRDKTLDQREAELDQRRSALDGRERSILDQETALTTAQKELATQKAQADADRDDFAKREQALAESTQALSNDRATLAKAQNDLAAREQALKDKQADYDARLQDYEALQQAVDQALGTRNRVAVRLTSALSAKGSAAAVEEDASVTLALDQLFSGNSAALTKAGEQALDALLPAWISALDGESVAALSVEVRTPMGDSQAMDLAARRAMNILEYAGEARSMDDVGRTAIQNKGLSGARSDAEGASRVVFRFYLNNDALRAARAG